ncbi:MAG: hypothetical protein AAB595_02925 [Patescibacteria group bacterium]
MSPEERELLNRSVSLAEDNNKMLRYIKSSMRWSSIARAIYWIFIVGSAVGAFYLIQPYTDQIMKVYNEVKSNLYNLDTILQGVKK